MTLSVVATRRSSVTALPESQLGRIRERFGWNELVVQHPLAGGYANDIYRAAADGTPIVLRVVRHPVDAGGLAWEHRLVRLLAPLASEVLAPLTDRAGETFEVDAQGAVVVMPFVDGAPAEALFDRAAAARALAHIHGAAARIEIEPRPGLFPLPRVAEGMASGAYFAAIGSTARPLPPELAERRVEVDAARAWALRTIDALGARTLTTAPIHGDVFPGNVLVREGRVVAFVDWEEANVDWVAYDVASSMWEFCNQGAVVLDHNAAADFVGLYREAGGTLPPDEDDALLPLVRIRRVLEILRAPYDRSVDWNYQLRNLRAYRGLG
jgi:Ser/Thr protein kinase RdoA (MazF antagonist)